MKHNFDERRQNRIAYAESQIAKNEAESNAAYQRASTLGKMIPMGQPILVGHHSERGHRAHLKKIDNAMRKSIDHSHKAKYYAEKVESIENNTAISSDDPNALEKLREQLRECKENQQFMKNVNAAVRKHIGNLEKQIAALVALNIPENRASMLLADGYENKKPFPSWKLTNNNANIKRIEQRIKQLEKIEMLQTEEITVGEVRIVQNVEANRVQIFFPSIPSEKVRSELKGRGFRWCRSEGAWQRHISGWAMRLAKDIAATFLQPTTDTQPI